MECRPASLVMVTAVFFLLASVFACFAMSQGVPVLTCPSPGCMMSGQLRRVLEHFRQSHDASSTPHDFIAKYKLQQCLGCHHWFLRLYQHSRRCKNGPMVSDGASCQPGTSHFELSSAKANDTCTSTQSQSTCPFDSVCDPPSSGGTTSAPVSQRFAQSAICAVSWSIRMRIPVDMARMSCK